MSLFANKNTGKHESQIPCLKYSDTKRALWVHLKDKYLQGEEVSL